NERGLLNPAISWPRGCVDEAGEGDRRPWRRRMATVPWSSVFRVSLLVILLAAIVIAFVTLPIEKVTLFSGTFWSGLSRMLVHGVLLFCKLSAKLVLFASYGFD
ncbi:hypothetical protein GW17_00020141, partial [Ensete ventricosum]